MGPFIPVYLLSLSIAGIALSENRYPAHPIILSQRDGLLLREAGIELSPEESRVRSMPLIKWDSNPNFIFENEGTH